MMMHSSKSCMQSFTHKKVKMHAELHSQDEETSEYTELALNPPQISDVLPVHVYMQAELAPYCSAAVRSLPAKHSAQGKA